MPSQAARAAVITTGDELLRGFVADANTRTIARDLRADGIELQRAQTCADDQPAIEAAIRATDEELVVLTGGLGPTHDDRTAAAVAAALDLPLERDPEVVRVVEGRIRDLAAGRGTDPGPLMVGVEKQATLPAGAVALEPAGTAPGFIVEAGGRLNVVLPGPPGEMVHAWRQVRAHPAYRALAGRAAGHVEQVLRTWDIPEARVAGLLEQLGHEDGEGCRVTLCAREGELEVSIRGADARLVEERTDGLARLLGDHVFARDEQPVAARVGRMLAERGLVAGCVESVTGGRVASLMAAVPGASRWFGAGIIAYRTPAKHDLLGIDGALLARHGAVSAECAAALSAAMVATGTVDVAVSVVGYAGPADQHDRHPVGTVFVAVHGPGGRHDVLRRWIPGERAAVQERAAVAALHVLRRHLDGC